jgi:hypothetical protein
MPRYGRGGIPSGKNHPVISYDMTLLEASEGFDPCGASFHRFVSCSL